MATPCIVICTAAVRDDVRLIWEAMGEGPSAFNRGLCAIDPLATDQTPATHYIIQDMGAQQEDVTIWAAMAENNDLPPISGTWGEDDIISSQDAQAAIANGNLFVFPAYGLASDQDRDNWRDGVLAGMGLQFVPDAPL